MTAKHVTRNPVNGQEAQADLSPDQPPIDAPASQPSPAARPKKRCPECGTETPPKRRGIMKIFCDSKCRAKFHARSKARGQALVPLMLAWRTGRGSTDISKRAYAEMNTILNTFASEDRQAGRPPSGEYVERLLWMGRHVDRRRK